MRDPLKSALAGWPGLRIATEWTTYADPMRTIAELEFHSLEGVDVDAKPASLRVEVLHGRIEADFFHRLLEFEMSAVCRAELLNHQSACQVTIDAGIGFAIVRLLCRFILAARQLPLTVIAFPAGRIAWSSHEFEDCRIDKPAADITDWSVTRSILPESTSRSSTGDGGRATYRSWGMGLFKLPEIVCSRPSDQPDSELHKIGEYEEAVEVLFDSLPPYLLRLGAPLPLGDVVELGLYDWQVTELPFSLATLHSPFGWLHVERLPMDPKRLRTRR